MRTCLKIILVLIILLISAVVITKYLSFARSYIPYNVVVAVRGASSAMPSTIINKHANYLITGTPYTASDVVADTNYNRDITATTGEPGDGQISAVSPTKIKLIYKNKVFEWDYIPRNGKIAALLKESAGNWDDLPPPSSR